MYLKIMYSSLLNGKYQKTFGSRTLTCVSILNLILIVLLFFNWNPSKSCEQKAVAQLKPRIDNVLESLDGVGFDFAKSKKDSSPYPIYYELEQNLEPCNLLADKPFPRNNISRLLKGWHDCIDPLFEALKNKGYEEFDAEFPKAAEQCDKIPEIENLKIDGFNNKHETKWAILPTCKEPHTMVTMGIGHDVDAEERLHRTLPDTTFYGADPIIEPNLQLYSSFGKFFPFAIGEEAGVQNFRILPNQNQHTRKYLRQDVTTVDVTYFLHNILKLQKIDFLWIDIEGGELLFIDQLHRGKALDEKGVVVCQFNIELHPDYWTNGYQIAYNFLAQIRLENRFIFLKSMVTGKGVYRLFFINVENQQCIRKYLQ